MGVGCRAVNDDEPMDGRKESALVTAATVVTMVIVLGIVWGGFLTALLTAIRREKGKN